jgi:malonate transporter
VVIYEVIFPIFAIAMGGYLVAYKQILSPQDIHGLSRFVFVIAFPILLFNSFANMEMPTQINWKFLFSYYLVVFVTFSLGMFIDKRAFSGTLKEQVIFALGSSYSNLILVGLPIISSGFGEQGILPLFMIVSVHSATFFSLSTVLIERGNHGGNLSGVDIARQTLKDLIRNPIILSLVLGLGINFTRIPIPQPVGDALDLFSRAALPCALFMLGASLNEYKVSGHLAEAGTIVGLKMILQPLLVWVMVFLVFHLDPLWGSVAVLGAGMPIGINTYLFAQLYQANTKTLSTAILLSSIFAIFSQTVLLTMFIQ